MACDPHPAFRRVDSVLNVRAGTSLTLSNQFGAHIFPVGIKYVLSPVILLKGREEARSLLLLPAFRLVALRYILLGEKEGRS